MSNVITASEFQYPPIPIQPNRQLETVLVLVPMTEQREIYASCFLGVSSELSCELIECMSQVRRASAAGAKCYDDNDDNDDCDL